METPALDHANHQIESPISTSEEVRSLSCRRLLDHLEPIFALYDGGIRTTFRNTFGDRISLELFGSLESSTCIGIPEIPGRRLAKEAHTIPGTIGAPKNT